ncbi:hypothetical protein [Rhodococcoides kyotonense]|uniref:Uncharacterized protein n=1 Tax=Rhodococcoides kyotonense TaxID=398843 RepID=A0A239NDH8_9NOCA|nr:hypothetical protein [Rhodococcus kyotonensis]SNT52810.1 hypothetical protein SAMN05421642_13618 [Rhodococcus kyotonensis]
MRTFARAVFVSAAAAPMILAAAGIASAAESTDVTYAFEVDGSTLTNTITNNTGGTLNCTTSVALAPGGELPPIFELGGQTIAETGEDLPGVTTQTLTDLPPGSYVALATCWGTAEGSPMWVSDYPGIEQVLAQFPNESFAVQQASTVFDIPGGETAPPAFPDLGELLRSGSAG